jgi:hypothetical protein
MKFFYNILPCSLISCFKYLLASINSFLKRVEASGALVSPSLSLYSLFALSL